MSGPSSTLRSGIGLPKAHEAYRRKEIAMETVTLFIIIASLSKGFQRLIHCELSRYFYFFVKQKIGNAQADVEEPRDTVEARLQLAA
jgi:hypothetical protein